MSEKNFVVTPEQRRKIERALSNMPYLPGIMAPTQPRAESWAEDLGDILVRLGMHLREVADATEGVRVSYEGLRRDVEGMRRILGVK